MSNDDESMTNILESTLNLDSASASGDLTFGEDGTL